MTSRSVRALLLASACALAVLLVGRELGKSVPSRTAARAPTESDVTTGAFDPQVAQRTVARLELFRTGNGGAELSLDADEVTAVVRHVLPGLLPDGVTQPVVRLVDGHVIIAVRVVAETYPGASPFAAVLDVLPDTLDVSIEGRLLRRARHLTLDIDGATAERVPIPRALLAVILAAVVEESPLGGAGPVTEGEDMAAELRLSWPAGIGMVEVVGDRLVVRRAEPFLLRAVDGDGGD